MKPRLRRAGFSLIELITAIGVSGILVLSCGVLMKMGVDDGEVVADGLAMEREIQLTVERLSIDLESAHGEIWHEGRSPDDCLYGWLTLKPLVMRAQHEAIGYLCAVGYTLRDFELRGSGEVQRRLVRQQRDGFEVFEALGSGDGSDLWSLHSQTEVLADGVLVFELWPMLRDGPESWQPWHPELRSMPDAVELCMVIASPGLCQRLRTPEDWEAASMNLDQFTDRDIQEVRTLIALARP